MAHWTHTKRTLTKHQKMDKKRSKQVPKQPTTQEATQDVDGNRATAETDVNTETTGIGSEKHIMQGDEKGKEEGGGKQTSTVHHTQNMERESPNDSKNSDTSIQTNDEPMTQEDLEPSQPDTEIHTAPPMMSPKRSKKLKTDRDTTQVWDRTRSRSRHKSPR